MSDEYQYGIRYQVGPDVVYASKADAEATLERMRSWPCTKHAQLIRRKVSIGEWE